MRCALFALSLAVLAIAPKPGFGQDMSQPMRMMQPPPPLQWPIIPAPPTPTQLLPAPKVAATAPLGPPSEYQVYPYAERAYYFGDARGYCLLDGAKVSGEYVLRRRW